MKAWRISAPATNVGKADVNTDIIGFPANIAVSPNSTIGYATGDANGTLVSGSNNITVTGINNDTVNVTLFLS